MINQSACLNMITQQLRTGEVLDESILDLYHAIPREQFVPHGFEAFAYVDMQIPLPHDQCMMTPLEEARLLQALELQGHEVVLEVGTGTGFLTALLSRRSQKVISIDCHADFTASAQQKLAEHKCTNVELITGDGSHGFFDQAPYDVIVLTGGLDAFTKTLALQVLPQGRVFTVIGAKPIMQGQLHRLDKNGVWHKRVLFETCLPPLMDRSKPEKFVF